MATPSIDTTALVIDNGTGTIKAGIAGDDAPRSAFRTIVGKPKMPGIMVGLDQKDVYIGDEAKEKKGVLKIECPIERGIIKDWNDMEKVWNHTIYQEMKTTPEEQAILLTEPPLNPKENREKTTEIMFDSFHVPCLYIGVQAVLALYASGKTTGLIVDSGEGITHTVPTYEGFAVPHAIHKAPLAGADLNDYFQILLKNLGYSFTTPDDMENVAWLKERVCQAALDYDATVKESTESKALERKEVLPDGNTVVVVGIERCQVPEVLFNPSLAKHPYDGIQKYADESIKKCDQDIRKDLYKNIVLAGGSTLFPGMAERLKKEIKKLSPSADVSTFAPPERKYSVWIGGSIVASLSTFSAMYITRTEYNEIGPEIVHRKCF